MLSPVLCPLLQHKFKMVSVSEHAPSPTTASPYTPLSASAQLDLQVLVHFTLSFRPQLSLRLHETLYCNPETSLLTATGSVYTSLITFVSASLHNAFEETASELASVRVEERLAVLRAYVERAVAKGAVRTATADEKGLPTARLRPGVRDTADIRYAWLRGPDGASCRIVASDGMVLMGKDVLKRADKLDASGRRADAFAAAWLRARMERGEARAKEVWQVWEDEKEKKLERERKEQERKERLCRIWGIREKEVEGMGRGRRDRGKVCYVESDAEEDDSDTENGENMSSVDDYVLDGEDGEDGEDSDRDDNSRHVETKDGVGKLSELSKGQLDRAARAARRAKRSGDEDMIDTRAARRARRAMML